MSKILVELQSYMGSDADIANAAWTSTYDKDRREDKYDDPQMVTKLVRSLIENGHGTPIESVIFRFWVRMPIFTDRQHMTHRIASHNGLSGRYRTMPLDYYKVPQDVEEIFILSNTAQACPPLEFLYRQSCDLAVENYSLTVDALRIAEKAGKITYPQFKRAREVAQLMLAAVEEANVAPVAIQTLEEKGWRI